jgi:hypothetical protein
MWVGAAYISVTLLQMEIRMLPEILAEWRSYHRLGGLGMPPASTYIPSLGAIYRSQVASIAKSYVGDSTDWAGGDTECNIFVQAMLSDASDATQLDIPYPVRPNLSWYQSSYRHPFVAADWANPNIDGGCWKPLSAGPDGALPGDIIATGWPPNGNDGTGHVGVVVEPNAGAPNYRDASSAEVAPYW